MQNKTTITGKEIKVHLKISFGSEILGFFDKAGK